MLSYLIIILILFFSYINFGLFLLRKNKLKLSPLEMIVLSAVLSISILVAIMVLLGPFLADKSYYLLIITAIIGLFSFKKNYLVWKNLFKSSRKNLWVIILLGILTLVLTSGMFFSGRIENGQLFLQDIYDTNWHIALERELLVNIPPRHPSSPNLILKNYHYFYDLFLSSLQFYSNISFVTLNYKVSQLIISSLLLLTAYIFGKRLKNQRLGIILVLLTVFAGNFGYLIPIFLKGQAWTESSFWVSQTFSMLVNPQVIFSISTLYLILMLMTKSFSSKKERHYLLIPLIAISIGFKTYGWIIMSLLYAYDLLTSYIVTRKNLFLKTGLVYIGFAAPFFYLITGLKTRSFFYQPLWFLDSMIEAPDRVNNIRWKFLLDHYLDKRNIPRVIWLRIKELFIFYFGNLGSRFIFIFLPLIKNKKRKFVNNKLIHLSLLGFLFSSIFPLLFLQTGTVWNSIQFWYYTLIFANILAAIFIDRLFDYVKLPIRIVFSIIFIAITLPAFLQTMTNKFKNFHSFPISQINFLSDLKKSDKILICPENSFLFHSAFINAFTPATIYLSDEGQLNLVEANLDHVKTFSKIFYNKQSAELKETLKKEKITHIICTDEDMINFLNQHYPTKEKTLLDWSTYSLKRI